MHICNCLSYTAEETFIHTSIHSTCSTWSLTENIVAEVKTDKITYLMRNSFRNQLRHCNVPPNHRPACSLISQQHCHPWAGHGSSRNKELTGLHIAKVTTPQGYTVGFFRWTTDQPSQQSWVYQAIQELGKANSKLVHWHQNHIGFQNTHTHTTQGNQCFLCNTVP